MNTLTYSNQIHSYKVFCFTSIIDKNFSNIIKFNINNALLTIKLNPKAMNINVVKQQNTTIHIQRFFLKTRNTHLPLQPK